MLSLLKTRESKNDKVAMTSEFSASDSKATEIKIAEAIEMTQKYKDHLWSLSNLLLLIFNNISTKFSYSYNSLILQTNSFGYADYNKESCMKMHCFFKESLKTIIYDLFEIVINVEDIEDKHIVDLINDRKTSFITENGILAVDFDNLKFTFSETKIKVLKPKSIKQRKAEIKKSKEKSEEECAKAIDQKITSIVKSTKTVFKQYNREYPNGYSLFIGNDLSYYLTLTGEINFDEPDGHIPCFASILDDEFGLLLDKFIDILGDNYTFEFDETEKYIIAYKEA